NCTDHFNCQRGNGNVVEQIESGCESGQWSNRVEGSTEPTLIVHKPLSSLSTTAREDCSACVSPELASELGITTDSVTHCVACNSACDQGLMRCFGIGASDCCNFYNNSVCVEQCPSPFVSNSDSICVCPEGTTGHNCEDDVDCGSLTDPVNGTISLTGTAFNSTATYSCNDGYSLVGDTTITCLASGLWSGEPPLCCTTNCIDCDVDGCKVCGADYKLENGVCKCVVTGCSSCESDSSKCDTCEEGRRLDDDKSACSECAVTGCSNCDSDVRKCDTCGEERTTEQQRSKSAVSQRNDG
ncbi:Sushi, von Willebrand factor type A, EGF and pentraxin domain-containing protein 1, partial [Geodia barretti]